MTPDPDPDRPQPQPQPVVSFATQLGGLVAGAFVAVGFVWFLIAGGITSENLGAVGQAVGGAVTAVIALLLYVWARMSGHSTAEQVTPVSSPRSAKGEELHTAAEWAARREVDDRDLTARWDTDFDRWRDRLPFSHHDTQELPAVTAGIHAHPTKKLGKLAPIPGRKAVPFGQFLTAAPDHPLVDTAPELVYPMYRNDVAGDCVVAALGHALQVICALLGVPWTDWTDDQVLAFYRTQNPNFRSWADGGKSVDGGMVIQTFLEYLVAQKVILAFGKVDHTNEDEMKAAAWLGLAVITGEDLEVAQQSQTVWDYKPSGDWGGHCTCSVGYSASPDRQTGVSWGQLFDMTQVFIAHQLDEAWFVLTQAHVDHPGFRNHFDLAGFAAAVAELTGGKVVVPVPAPQPPVPGPPPAPGPAPSPAPVTPSAADVAWAKQVLTEGWRSKRDKKVAGDILTWAGLGA